MPFSAFDSAIVANSPNILVKFTWVSLVKNVVTKNCVDNGEYVSHNFAWLTELFCSLERFEGAKKALRGSTPNLQKGISWTWTLLVKNLQLIEETLACSLCKIRRISVTNRKQT